MGHFFSLFFYRWSGSNGQGTCGDSSSLCTWVGGGGRVLVLIIFSWVEGRRVLRLSWGYLVSYSSFLGWRVLVLITLFWLEGREGSTLVGMVWQTCSIGISSTTKDLWSKLKMILMVRGVRVLGKMLWGEMGVRPRLLPMLPRLTVICILRTLHGRVS